MIFILKIVRILPAFLINQSHIDIFTPSGRQNLLLETGASLEIRVPDFITILTFGFRHRRVSYPLVNLMCRPKINFAPLPLILHFDLTREFQKEDTRLQVIGHRGSGSNDYRKMHNLPRIPENTVQSFQNAYKLGAKLVEFDVCMTSDDEIVVFHDFAFEGTPVWKMTLKEFQQRRAVQTLNEVLDATNRHLILIVEIKYPSREEIEEQNLSNDPPDLKSFIDRVLDILEDHPSRTVLVGSYDPEVLLILRTKSPDILLYFLTEGVPNKFSDHRRNRLEDAIQFCTENDIQWIVTDSETIAPNPIKLTALVHNAGLSLAVYFWRILSQEVDFAAAVEELDCAGVDGIVTDDIRGTLAAINSRTSCHYGNRSCSNGGLMEWTRNHSNTIPERGYEA